VAESARDWLVGLEAAGIALGLTPIRTLLAELGHPERTFTTVTVAGTNGKGSVTAILERGFRAAGCRTGRYISPHLIAIEERAAISGIPLSRDAFDRAARHVRLAARALPAAPTYFEATTALALVAFRDADVELAVLEVGLGGRLDATNAVDARLVAVTAIGLDHQEYLGSTLAAVAAEKAGVIKPGAAVVAGRNPAVVLDVLRAAAVRESAAIHYAPDGVSCTATISARETRLTLRTPAQDYGDVRLALPGRHQVDNAITAVRTLEAAQALGLAPVDATVIRTALSDVEWPGRLDWRRWRHQDVLIDGAHNADGARALTAFLRETVATPVPMVVGIMRDKALAEILTALAPVASRFVFTKAATARAASPHELADLASRLAPNVPHTIAASPLDALTLASGHGSPIVVAGSLLLAGEILIVLA
jgi:dihydrofolate synthase/folylpolyglutamate synthase